MNVVPPDMGDTVPGDSQMADTGGRVDGSGPAGGKTGRPADATDEGPAAT